MLSVVLQVQDVDAAADSNGPEWSFFRTVSGTPSASQVPSAARTSFACVVDDDQVPAMAELETSNLAHPLTARSTTAATSTARWRLFSINPPGPNRCLHVIAF